MEEKDKQAAEPTFQFNFYGSVGQNIARVERMEVHFDKDMTMQVGSVGECSTAASEDTPAQVPECLRTPKACVLWQRAQAEGWVDERWQPVGLSRPDAALLAFRIGQMLGIDGWKPFEQLWSRPNIRQDYNKSQYNQKTDEFENELKRALK